jgi:hypothetical protein
MQSRMGSRTPKGFVKAYSVESGDDIWVMAIFEDEASYRANASSPEQDRDYQEMRALLDADPEWHDGVITDRS